MESLLVLFTYNRPQVLQACVQTLFGGTQYPFDEVLIINDGSTPQVSKAVVDFTLQNQNHSNTNFSIFHSGKNRGYSYSAELAFTYAKMRNPKYFFFIEQDYVFRKGWAEEVLAVFEASPKTAAISGYSNPDFFDPAKYDQMFRQIIVEDFGSDPCAREFMYKPFDLDTKLGKIKVQGGSNSCGCSFINWELVVEIIKEYPEFWEKVIERACNMNGPSGNRQNYGDGPFTHGLSWYWYQFWQGLDYNNEKEFPWLDICDYSLSQHLNGGSDSINGKIVAECSTFVGSPKWKDDYANKNPRKSIVS